MEPLKDNYNQSFFDDLCARFIAVYPEFDSKKFLKDIFDDKWQGRELKGRMRHISLCLNGLLPAKYSDALEILKKVSVIDGGKLSYLYMFFPDFVELYGQNYWVESMSALEVFTQYSSSEFAIRPFIKNDQSKAMQQMLKWSKSDNYHVRRLASEGCRPRLPWTMALPELKKNPEPILPILENLKNDESEYVRRSVANNLNDIAKDHPEKVIEIARKWLGQGVREKAC